MRRWNYTCIKIAKSQILPVTLFFLNTNYWSILENTWNQPADRMQPASCGLDSTDLMLPQLNYNSLQ